MSEPTAELYPPSPANERNRVWRDAAWGKLTDTHARPTLPGITRWPGEPSVRAAPIDPLDALRVYPETINAEYLTPMSKVIEDAITAGDPALIATYAQGINQGIAVELARRTAAAFEDIEPHVAAIAGAVSVDNAVADGTAVNTVVFTATDQNGEPIVAALTIASDKATATPTPASGNTAADGTLSVNVVDTVAEAVTLTAASGSVTGPASVTFSEPPPPEEEEGQRERGES